MNVTINGLLDKRAVVTQDWRVLNNENKNFFFCQIGKWGDLRIGENWLAVGAIVCLFDVLCLRKEKIRTIGGKQKQSLTCIDFGHGGLVVFVSDTDWLTTNLR